MNKYVLMLAAAGLIAAAPAYYAFQAQADETAPTAEEAAAAPADADAAAVQTAEEAAPEAAEPASGTADEQEAPAAE